MQRMCKNNEDCGDNAVDGRLTP